MNTLITLFIVVSIVIIAFCVIQKSEKEPFTPAIRARKNRALRYFRKSVSSLAPTLKKLIKRVGL